MKRFIEGVSRSQSTLFPERLEDFIAEDNPVKVIDAFVDRLPLLTLGFEGVEPLATGRPSYHPSVMLKIYVYGYLNRIHSSRRLERETQRNVELMWLTGRLTPDFKTIADFRKDNGKAIKKVCQKFVMVCRQLDLFANALVAIDGSKFKAVNNRDKNFTPAKMKRRLEQVEHSIERYLAELERADDESQSVPEAKVERLHARLATLTEEMDRLQLLEQQMLDAPDRQLSLTDPDSRSMKTRGAGIVGYNAQIAVDATHHLIAAHEVTNVGIDFHQLANMAKQARSAMGAEDLSVVTTMAQTSWRVSRMASPPTFRSRTRRATRPSNCLPSPTSSTSPLTMNTNVLPVNVCHDNQRSLRPANTCTVTGTLQPARLARSKRSARPVKNAAGSDVGNMRMCSTSCNGGSIKTPTR
jgi:transposase